MAAKKPVSKKKLAPRKKTVAKKTTKKKQARKAQYVCEVCGLSVTVDNECGCIESCDLICCGEQMQTA